MNSSKNYQLKMKIKRWKEFNESNIPVGTQTVGGSSGGTTAPVGDMGPNYGRQELRNTIDQRSTDVIYSEIDSKIYTYDDYQQAYQDYLKKGGKPLQGFNQENLTTVLTFKNED
jgi:hypothetical protein